MDTTYTIEYNGDEEHFEEYRNTFILKHRMDIHPEIVKIIYRDETYDFINVREISFEKQG